MGVAQFQSEMSAFPTALLFSGEGELQPVAVYYCEPAAFAKGGLVKEAAKIRAAGRHGDTETIHINKEELEELTQMWGPPSINPETGMPEFFLKKVWKKVKKIAKPLASIAQFALPFIPGIGPIASVALGAGLGGITGGVKGAISGGLGGAIGGGLGTKLGSKLGIGAVGGNALLGGASGLATGGVKGLAAGALSGGLAGGLGGQLGERLQSAGLVRDPRLASALGNGLLGGLAAGVGGGNPIAGMLGAGGASWMSGAGLPYGPTTSHIPGEYVSPELQRGTSNEIGNWGYGYHPEQTPYTAPTGPALPTAYTGTSPEDANLRIGAAATAASGLGAVSSKKKKKTDPYADLMTNPYGHLPSVFSGNLPEPNGIFKNLGQSPAAGSGRPTSYEDWLTYGMRPEASFFNYAVPGAYAKGGSVRAKRKAPPKPREEFRVHGAGTGRSDSIPAVLSDGEYVMDAETVALLGDGSTKAGADKLDQFRVNLRKHKGKHLSKGKISPDAKHPEAYFEGGRV